jgi:Rod binding domain-containing protein
MPTQATEQAKEAADLDKARRACKDFEAILLYHLLSSMRSAFQSEEESSGGLGGDIFRSMMDEQLSLALARSGGIGLASMLEKGLGLEDLTQKTLPSALKLIPGKAASPQTEAGAVPGLGAGRLTVKDLSRVSFPAAPETSSQPGTAQPATAGIAATEPTGEVAAPAENGAEQTRAPVDISNLDMADGALARIRRFEPTIKAAATVFGLSTDLIKAVILHESGGNPRAVSHKGAKGLMQLTDGTARDLGVTNPFDPVQNIFGGARFLAGLLKKFGGDLELALASYNAGPGAVLKYGGIPPFKETQEYVRRIVASLGGKTAATGNTG